MLAELLEETLDLDGLTALAEEAPEMEFPGTEAAGERTLRDGSAAPGTLQPSADSHSAGPVRVAVARDEAFCFMYRDNLTLL